MQESRTQILQILNYLLMNKVQVKILTKSVYRANKERAQLPN